MSLALRRWSGLLAIYVKDGMAYKAQMAIWILTDLVLAILMPLVWSSAAKSGDIGGYSNSDFIVYYIAMLALGCFITSHFMWDISFEIREGVFSGHLLRPLHYLEFIFIRNLAWRIVRFILVIPMAFGALLFFGSQLSGAQLFWTPEFFLSVILGHCVSVAFVAAFAMIALFTEEASAIFELYYVPLMFLSGQLIPISLMPPWVQVMAKWSPFYYTVGAPTDLLTGKLASSAAGGVLLAQLFWLIGSLIAFHFLFRAGMKVYSGVGH